MTHTKTSPKPTAPDADPATLAHRTLLERQRKNARRTLLKRRRQKSGQ